MILNDDICECDTWCLYSAVPITRKIKGEEIAVCLIVINGEWKDITLEQRLGEEES